MNMMPDCKLAGRAPPHTGPANQFGLVEDNHVILGALFWWPRIKSEPMKSFEQVVSMRIPRQRDDKLR